MVFGASTTFQSNQIQPSNYPKNLQTGMMASGSGEPFQLQVIFPIISIPK